MARSFFSALMTSGETVFFTGDYSGDGDSIQPTYTCPDDTRVEIHEIRIVAGAEDWSTGFGGTSLSTGFALATYDSAGESVDSFLVGDLSKSVGGLVAGGFEVASDASDEHLRGITWRLPAPIVLEAGASLRWILADDFSGLFALAFMIRGSI